MKSKFLFGALVAVVTFALVVGVSMAVAEDPDCTHLSVECTGWDESNPLIPGTCCLVVYASATPCGTGTMAEREGIIQCAVLVAIENGVCGEEPTAGGVCGGVARAAGNCNTGQCGGS